MFLLQTALFLRIILIFSLSGYVQIPANCDEQIDYIAAGLEAVEKLDYEEALRHFDCVVGLDIDNPEVYYYRAGVYSFLFRYEEAILDYARVLDLTSEELSHFSVSARFFRALTYIQLEEYAIALVELNDLIQLSAMNVPSSIYGDNQGLSIFYATRAIIYNSLNETDKALADYDHAIELDPNNFSAYVERGFIYESSNQPAKAKADWAIALKFEHNIIDSYRALGVTAYNNKKYANAATLYDKAIKLSEAPLSHDYMIRGLSHLELGNYPQAIADFDQAIALDANETAAIFYKGVAYLEMQEYEAAITEFDKYLKINPIILSTYFLRAQAHYRNEAEKSSK